MAPIGLMCIRLNVQLTLPTNVDGCSVQTSRTCRFSHFRNEGVRAFTMDSLKFKLKFVLRSYFFYFGLSLFKILTFDSLFSTLFHLNIHYLLLFFFYFLNSQKTFLSHFSPPSPSVPLYIPSLFFFSSFFPTTHVPFLFSFFFLLSFLFFPHHPRTPLPFFLLLPHSNFINRNLATSAKKNPANLQTFTAILQKIIANLQIFTVILRKIIKAKSHTNHHHHWSKEEEEAAKEAEEEEEREERETVAITITDLKKNQQKKQKKKKKKKKEKREMVAERLKERERGRKE